MTRIRGSARSSSCALSCLIFVFVLGLAAPASAVELVPVTSFPAPVHVTAPRSDYERLFVVQQDGVIGVVDGARKRAKPFLDIRKFVTFGGERGLLSMAFAPDYRRSRKFYVYYTSQDVEGRALGDIVIEEYKRSKRNPNRASRASRRTVLTVPHNVYPNHNGGQLQFGPDRMLYIGTGDGGAAYDPDGNGQDLESLLGKVLRINPRPAGEKPYRIPESNPFASGDGADEIYAYGLRNPWRFSFDRMTKDLVIADVGQNVKEEVNFLPSGTPGGANFGWSSWEGTTPAKLVPPPDDHVEPVHERDHLIDGVCSITGGYVVRDKSLKDLYGRYVYGDYCQAELRSLELGLPEATDDQPLGIEIPSVSSFGEDAAGCLYATSLDGDVFRFQAKKGKFRGPCRKPT
jgi:glucose/arabinose dehydrogenase